MEQFKTKMVQKSIKGGLLICLVIMLVVASMASLLTSSETALAAESVDYATVFSYTTTDNGVTITGFNDSYIEGLSDTEKFDIALVIPATIEDNPVVAVDSQAFAFKCDTYYGDPDPAIDYSVSSLSFAEATNLKTIGDNAFAGICATGTLTFPDTCSGIDIGSQAFIHSDFEAFEASENSINSIAKNAFTYSNISGHVVIPEGVTTYGGTIFGNTEVTSISLPSSITEIGSQAFSSMNSLEFAKINFEFDDTITDDDGNIFSSSNKFMTNTLSSGPVIILASEESYDYIYDLTLNSNQKLLSYEMTLTFDGLDASYNRDVLYNKPINWEKDDNGFTWSACESYYLPTLETGLRWSFTDEKALVTDTIITAEFNVAGDVLYAVAEENVSDSYTYFAFGSYPQTQLGSLSKGTMTDEEFDAAIAEQEAVYEAQGIEIYRYESGDSLVYWFKMEPILWRVVASSTDGDITAYRLWSEYVIDQQSIGENIIYTDGFTSTPLYAWLQNDFKQTAFTTDEQDFIQSITLMNYSDFITIKGWGVNHLKAFKSDFANYIGSSNYYWLSYTYPSANYSLIGYNTTGVSTLNSYGSQYNYSTAGVRPDITIYQDTTKYATTGSGTFDDPYMFVELYTYTFYDEDGETVLKSESVSDGTEITAPIDPTKTATAQFTYSFDGWYDAVSDGNKVTDFGTVSADVSYYANYTSTTNKYTITWINGDETTTTEVEYGTLPTAPTASKTNTDEFTYTNGTWGEITSVTGEKTYTATFTETKNKYTITWVNGDETTTDSVEYGTTPTAPTASKTNTDEFTYSNGSWGEITSVTGEKTYTATFTETKNKYTITWINGNETTTDSVEYGTTPTAPTASKTNTDEFTYTNGTWGEITSVTGEKTYTATFTETKNKYTITWVNGDETTTTEVEYGVIPTYNGVTPTKSADDNYTYIFDSWNGEVVAVAGDTTYTATFTQTATVGSLDENVSATELKNALDASVEAAIHLVETLKSSDESVNSALSDIQSKIDAIDTEVSTYQEAQEAQKSLETLLQESEIVADSTAVTEITENYSYSKDFVKGDEEKTITVVVSSESAITYAIIEEEIAENARADFAFDYSGYTIEQEFTIVVEAENGGIVVVDTGVLWESNKNYTVIHWTVDGVEVLEECYKLENGNVGFETTEFSPFQLLSTETSSFPMILWILIVLGILALGVIGFMVCKKKRALSDGVSAQRNAMQANIVEEEVVAIANEPYPNEQQVCNEEESISNEEETDNEVLATMDSEVVSIADNDVQSPAVQEMDDARISIMIRYNKSFKAKLIQADDTVKNYYCELKNLIMSNKKVTSRLSWACDSINIGRTKLVKFNVRGKTLYVYLALDPNEFADSKIKVEVAKGKRFASTPCLCKIKNPRRFNVAKQLIEKLSEKFALQHVETEPQDYYLAYETTENLIESKLIKELVSKDKYNSFQ